MKKQRSRQSGVTLIEMLVVIAIIGIITAVMVPMVTKYIDDARVARAQADCNAIRTAVTAFYKDTGRWPDTSGSPATLPSNLYTLFTAGTRANGGGNLGWGDTSSSSRMRLHFTQNLPGATVYPIVGERAWRGPYMAEDKSDAWGRAYEINIRASYTATANEASAIYCLSAGPNMTFETTFLQAGSAAVVGGDDIAIRIR
jgi:prepilin-type N-terminal cleavage/methylation domain-containing protein